MLEVYKRTDSPYWWYKVPLLDDNGHVIRYERGSTKRRDKGEAKLVARKLAKSIQDADQLGKRETTTIVEAGRRYLMELEAEGKPSAKDARTFVSRASTGPGLSKPLTHLNAGFLSNIKQQRLMKGYAPRSINNELTFWISVFNRAKDKWMLMVDRDASFDGIKLKPVAKTRYLLDGEEERLLAELEPTDSKTQDQYDLVLFLLDTGARYTEIASIPWTAINGQSVNLLHRKVGQEGTLTLTDRCRAMLDRRWRTHGNYKFVFPSDTKSDAPRGYSTKGIRHAIERAGLNEEHLVERYGRFTVHSLRHTFASRLVQAGMSLYAVSQLLGHSDISMTQRYAHLAPSQVSQQAADILNKREKV